MCPSMGQTSPLWPSLNVYYRKPRTPPEREKTTTTSTIHNSTTMSSSFGTEISGNRRPNHELSNEARAAIVSRVLDGAPRKDVAREFRVSPKTIYNTMKRWDATRNNDSRPRAGRPKRLSDREKRAVSRQARKAPKICYAAIAEEAHVGHASRTTIYRTLHEYGLTNNPCKGRPQLKAKRLQLKENRNGSISSPRGKTMQSRKHITGRTENETDDCAEDRGS